MLKDLRLRLTLLFLLIGVGLVAVLSIVTYSLLRYYFISSTDQALKAKMGLQFIALNAPIPADLYESISTSRLFAIDTMTIPSDNETPAIDAADKNEEATEARNRGLQESELADIFVIPLSITGTPAKGSTSSLSPAVTDQAAFAQAIQSGSDLRTVTTSDGIPIRLLTYRISSQAGIAAIQAGVSLQPEMNVLAQLLRGLILIGAGSVFFIGTGAWLLAGRYIRRTQLAFEKQQSFVANASHELRAPLTLIRAGIEVAKRESRDPRQIALLDNSLADADYMKRLIEDLLLLSRLDTQTVRLEKEPVQFPDFLQTVAQKMEVIAAGSDVSISAESDAFQLSADPNRLQQVLFILVDNAVRNNRPGGFIRLTGRLAGDHAMIAVIDSGKGIPEEHLEKVFDRFYTVDDGSKAAQKGSGLGLSIASGLIHAHQGRIKIASKPGKGTAVTITLPLKTKSVRK